MITVSCCRPSPMRSASGKDASRALLAQFAVALRDRQLLLVLDNLEQVLDAAPSWPTCWQPAHP